MNLMDMITGNKSPSDGARTGFSLNLMDRIVNPATMAGLAMIGGKDPIEAASLAENLQAKHQQTEAMKYFASSLPPEERAIAMMAPAQYVAARMAKLNNKPFAVGKEGRVFDPATNSWMTPPGSDGTGKPYSQEQFDKEFDGSKFTPDSWLAARDAGDPRMLMPGGPEVTKNKLQAFELAQNNVEKRLTPIRQGMQAIQMGRQLLREKGGAADYSALVTYVKAADPGTAAMAGEVGAAGEAQGYMNELNQIATKIAGNGFLTVEQKQQMDKAYSGMERIYKKIYDHSKDHYAGKFAKTFELDPELIMGAPIDFGNSSGALNATPNPTLPDAIDTFKDSALQTLGIGGNDHKPAAIQPQMHFEIIDGKMTRVK